MYVFMEANDLFPIEQKGCGRGSCGCKDQLLINRVMINRMIIEDCKSKQKFEYGLIIVKPLIVYHVVG